MINHEVIVNLIGHTTTKTGLTIQADLDQNTYPTGITVVTKTFAPSTSFQQSSMVKVGTTPSNLNGGRRQKRPVIYLLGLTRAAGDRSGGGGAHVGYRNAIGQRSHRDPEQRSRRRRYHGGIAGAGRRPAGAVVGADGGGGRGAVAGWNRRNPIDLFQSATPECYAAAVGAVLDDAGSDAVLVLHGPTALADPLATAAAIAARLAHRRKPVAVVWLDRATRTAAQDILAAQRVPVHDNQRQAIAAFLHLVAYHRNQDMLMQTPASVPDRFERDRAAMLAIVHRALDTGREWLDEPETLAVLAAYGVPVARLRGAATVEDAVRAAGEIGYPVRLDRADAAAGERGTDRLDEAGAVRAAARGLERRHRERHPPEQAFPGWVVRSTEAAAPVSELWLGVAPDRRFGPVIVFGRGGSRRAVHPDHAVGLPPLDLTLAKRLMTETRVYHDLAAAGQCAPESLEELALLLVKLSQLTTEVAKIVEIDIDPLPIARAGVRVGSARARVAPATGAAADRLAIRPYPNELEKAVISRAGRTFLLRPIRPEDEPALQELVQQMDPEDIRMPFFSSIRKLDHRLAAQLSQIDYDREMAFVLVNPTIPPPHLQSDAAFGRHRGRPGRIRRAVRFNMKGHGLGRILMQEIVAYGRQIGLREIWREVLAQNASMLGLAENLGFRAYPCRTTRAAAMSPSRSIRPEELSKNSSLIFQKNFLRSRLESGLIGLKPDESQNHCHLNHHR